MSVDALEMGTDAMRVEVSHHANELIALIRHRHPEARFRGPFYWSHEHLWVIEAFFNHGEDFELQELLSERETDILLANGIWLVVLPLPLSAHEPFQG
ncbi:MAG: hypothetical protein M5U01_26710 [Ardenticatenaceae bacterium]|nr:hypothetical protein [Ardenticatenaceae bacterium]HBY93741.1 hypothetical protein [Chloroflexota bacterium]